jgi:hypothetical protein
VHYRALHFGSVYKFRIINSEVLKLEDGHRETETRNSERSSDGTDRSSGNSFDWFFKMNKFQISVWHFSARSPLLFLSPFKKRRHFYIKMVAFCCLLNAWRSRSLARYYDCFLYEYKILFHQVASIFNFHIPICKQILWHRIFAKDMKYQARKDPSLHNYR